MVDLLVYFLPQLRNQRRPYDYYLFVAAADLLHHCAMLQLDQLIASVVLVFTAASHLHAWITPSRTSKGLFLSLRQSDYLMTNSTFRYYDDLKLAYLSFLAIAYLHFGYLM